MDHCFRKAIWMFLLLGFLQARPLSKPSIDVSNVYMEDLDFEGLKIEVVCGENVTFVSPLSVPTNLSVKALRVMKDGLEHAQKNCNESYDRLADTLQALGQIPNFSEMMGSSNYTSENKGTPKNFATFLKECETFIQRLKSTQA